MQLVLTAKFLIAKFLMVLIFSTSPLIVSIVKGGEGGGTYTDRKL